MKDAFREEWEGQTNPHQPPLRITVTFLSLSLQFKLLFIFFVKHIPDLTSGAVGFIFVTATNEHPLPAKPESVPGLHVTIVSKYFIEFKCIHYAFSATKHCDQALKPVVGIMYFIFFP